MPKHYEDDELMKNMVKTEDETENEDAGFARTGRFIFILIGMVLAGIGVFYVTVIHEMEVEYGLNGEISVSSVIADSSEEIEPAEKVDIGVMDTIVTQKIYGENSEETANEISDLIKNFEKRISPYEPESEISLLNSLAGTEQMEISDEVFGLLVRAKELNEMSFGYFDVTVGPLISLWSISSGSKQIPDVGEINSALPLIGSDKITLFEETKSAALELEDMKIDLGGMGKGYACDLAVEKYKEKSVLGALISIGGDIAAVGKKPDGSDFVVGIQDPRGQNGEIFASVEISDEVIATSGDYERYFEKNGAIYHHIFNPKTGYPAETDLISVSVICESGIMSDYFATLLFIEGKEAALSKINDPYYSMIIVDKDKNVYVSEKIKESFNFKGADTGYIYVE